MGDDTNKEENIFEPHEPQILETELEKKGSTTDPVISVKESEWLKVKEEAGKYREQYLRIYAEFENARKRMEREKMDFAKYATETVMSDFLNVVDDLERTVEVAAQKHSDYDAFLKGIEMVMGRIYEMLKKHQVRAMESQGKVFDPHCHEALLQVESAEHADGLILQELQKGYYLADRVLRTAKVKVAKQAGSDSGALDG